MTQSWYTSVERLYSLEPAIGSRADLTSAQIMTSFIEPVEALVNAMLANLYTVPIQPAPPLIAGIADDLGIYRILSRRIYTAQQLKTSTWPDRFKESWELLVALSKGDMPLTTASGDQVAVTDASAHMGSNNEGYLPTFFEGDPVDWRIDSNKLDTLYSDRETT